MSTATVTPYRNLSDLAEALSPVVGNPLRLAVFREVAGGNARQSEIVQALRKPYPNLQYAVQTLSAAGLIASKKDGSGYLHHSLTRKGERAWAALNSLVREPAP